MNIQSLSNSLLTQSATAAAFCGTTVRFEESSSGYRNVNNKLDKNRILMDLSNFLQISTRWKTVNPSRRCDIDISRVPCRRLNHRSVAV